MSQMQKQLLSAALFLALAAPLEAAPREAAPAAGTAEQSLTQILAAPHRSAANRARDSWRHPAETLRFFGVQPGMTIVEVLPGAGWYTEILAPFIGSRGKIYAAHYAPTSPNAIKAVENYRAKLAADPALYGNVTVTALGKGYSDIAPEASADMVLTFRNIHNMYMGDWAAEGFAAFYRALKPGGVLGIVEHRLPEARADSDMEKSGYMKTSTVRALAEAAGFRFVGQSEINANPRDTADHPGGVWSLPPTLRGGDSERAKYEAIGESDRMTLKFIKPAS